MNVITLPESSVSTVSETTTPVVVAPPIADQQALRMSPYAWAKMRYFQSRIKTEIGGLCITAPGDPLFVVDVFIPKQEVSACTVAFDDDSIAEFTDQQVAAEVPQEQFFRIWLHTHPGPSCAPSGKDNETFNRILGPHLDWCVMAIIGTEGAMYAELQQAGPRPWLPRAKTILKAYPDFNAPFPGSDHQLWAADLTRVHERKWITNQSNRRASSVAEYVAEDTPHILQKAIDKVYSGGLDPFQMINSHKFRNALLNRATAWNRLHYPKWYKTSRQHEDVAMFLHHWGLTLREWADHSTKEGQEYTTYMEKWLHEEAKKTRNQLAQTPTIQGLNPDVPDIRANDPNDMFTLLHD